MSLLGGEFVWNYRNVRKAAKSGGDVVMQVPIISAGDAYAIHTQPNCEYSGFTLIVNV